MKNKKSIILIIIGIILISIIGVIVTDLYNKSVTIKEFDKFIIEYKKELDEYSLFYNKNKYDELIKECNYIVLNKSIDDIKEIKESLNSFKEESVSQNIEGINLLLKEVENIDTTILKNKDNIINEIDKIKVKIKDGYFKIAKDNIEKLKKDIHNEIEIAKNLEIKRIEEEKKRQEEQRIKEEEEKRKREEELFNNIDGAYKFDEFNKNGFHLRSYSMTLRSFGDNRLLLSGGHNTANAIISNPPISFEEATKEHQGLANHKSGMIIGELDYVGNYIWKGYIGGDGIGRYGEILDSNNKVITTYIPTVPIEIKIQDTDILVTIDEQSVMRGTHIFKKDLDKDVNYSNKEEFNKEKDERPRVKDYLKAIQRISEECGPEAVKGSWIIKCYEKPLTKEALPFDEQYYKIDIESHNGGENNFYVGKDSNTVYRLDGTSRDCYLRLIENKEIIESYITIENYY